MMTRARNTTRPTQSRAATPGEVVPLQLPRRRPPADRPELDPQSSPSWPDHIRPYLLEAGEPHVLLLGESSIVRSLRKALEARSVDVRRAAATPDAIRSMTPWTRAIVVVPPLPILRVETALPALERPAASADADLFVVASEERPRLAERVEHVAQERDAEAYAWPRDAVTLMLRLCTPPATEPR